MHLSVIVPATVPAPTLPRCLAAIEAARPDELLVAAEPAGATPAAARNLAAARATGDVLVFVDADVLVHRDALDRIRSHEGVEHVMVLGRDGLLIQHAGNGALDAETVSAMVPGVAQAASALGGAAGAGGALTVAVRLERSVAVVQELCEAVSAAGRPLTVATRLRNAATRDASRGDPVRLASTWASALSTWPTARSKDAT